MFNEIENKQLDEDVEVKAGSLKRIRDKFHIYWSSFKGMVLIILKIYKYI